MENEKHTHSPSPCKNSSHQTESETQQTKSSATRRGFLRTAGWGAAALTASGLLPGSLVPDAEAKEISPFVNEPEERAEDLEKVRERAAEFAAKAVKKAVPHLTNGDEERYKNQAFAGNFSKTMPHDPNTGLVAPNAYISLLAALRQGTQAAFDAVPSGGPGKFTGPLSPLQFQMEGSDSPDAKSPFVPP